MCNKKQQQQELSYFSNKRGKIPLLWWNHGNYPVITIYGPGYCESCGIFIVVETNGVLHVHNLAWIAQLLICYSSTVVILKFTDLLPSMWWLWTCLPVLLWDIGKDLLPNILPQNYRQPRWNLLGDCRVSIVPGSCLRFGIYKVPGFGQGNHVLFILLVGVHTSPWLHIRRCIHCAPCLWDFIYLRIKMGSWISVSLYILLYKYNYSGKYIWCPYTCTSIWCRRWRCWYLV